MGPSPCCRVSVPPGDTRGWGFRVLSGQWAPRALTGWGAWAAAQCPRLPARRAGLPGLVLGRPRCWTESGGKGRCQQGGGARRGRGGRGGGMEPWGSAGHVLSGVDLKRQALRGTWQHGVLGLGPGGQGSHRAWGEWTEALGQKAGTGDGDRKMSRAEHPGNGRAGAAGTSPGGVIQQGPREHALPGGAGARALPWGQAMLGPRGQGRRAGG